MLGVGLLALTLLLSFTGYLLPWDQLAYWAVTVGTNMARSTAAGRANRPVPRVDRRADRQRHPLCDAGRHDRRPERA